MKLRILSFLLLSIFVAVTISLSPAEVTPQKTKASNFYEDIGLFTDVLSIIQLDYVEEKKSKDLIYGSLKGMLQSLDPHSQFMTPDTYTEMKIETEALLNMVGN